MVDTAGEPQRTRSGTTVVQLQQRHVCIPVSSVDHVDIFLVNKLLTVRVYPFGRIGPSHLRVRAGGGSELSKLKITPAQPRPRAALCPASMESEDVGRRCNRKESAVGSTLGAGYWIYLPWDHASLGIDYAWNTIRINNPFQVADVTLGLQWRQ